MTVSERVHTFGEDGTLVGLASLPPGDDGASAPDRPFVVMLNAGLVHRVGPFRLYVELARRLAASGTRVFRYDRSGIGDSALQPGSASVDERSVLDARAALDCLRDRYGTERFVALGLCRGAMNAHLVGVADERVVGVCLLDGYAYPTFTAHRHRVITRLKQPRTWPKTLRGLATRARTRVERRLGRAPAATQTRERDPRLALFSQPWPLVSRVRADIERMLTRGVQMLFVYSGGWSTFSGLRQFDEMFPRLPRRDRVTVRYHERADHTYFAVDTREDLFQDVGEFVERVR